MKYFLIILCAACASSCVAQSNQLTPQNQSNDASKFDALATRFIDDYAALEIPAHELSFAANLQNLKSPDALKQQQAVFQEYDTKLSRINSARLGLCDRIDHGIMSTMVWLGARRAELGLQYLGALAAPNEPQSLLEVALGKEWYRYYLAYWNSADLKPDAIFAFGETALTKSVAAYDALQAEMGFAGDDTGFSEHLEKNAPRLDGGAATRDLFKTKQDRVWENLTLLFPESFGVTPAKIERSDRGEAFAVPGYYDLENQTFFYNLFEPAFEARQADWLFLHEATPGHHFQLTATRRCEGRFQNQFFPAYSEGWAAYVENLGEELGLYRTPEEKLAAVEWDMVRSVRVVLDVALNAYGWSDEEALDYWYKNVRGQRDVAQREIDRMKRWPAQVITYKYGADVFQTIKREYATGADAALEVKLFHGAAISYGSMPLSVFDNLFSDLVKPE